MGVNILFHICLLAIPDEKDGSNFNKLFKSKCEQFVVSLKEILNTPT